MLTGIVLIYYTAQLHPHWENLKTPEKQGCSKSLEGKRFARPFICTRFYLDPVKGTKILSAEQPNSTVVILVSSRGLRISFLQLRPVIIAAGSDKIVLTCPSLNNVFNRLTDEGRQR